MVSHKKSVAPAVLGCDPHPPPSPADGDPEGGALDLSLPLSLSLTPALCWHRCQSECPAHASAVSFRNANLEK